MKAVVFVLLLLAVFGACPAVFASYTVTTSGAIVSGDLITAAITFLGPALAVGLAILALILAIGLFTKILRRLGGR